MAAPTAAVAAVARAGEAGRVGPAPPSATRCRREERTSGRVGRNPPARRGDAPLSCTASSDMTTATASIAIASPVPLSVTAEPSRPGERPEHGEPDHPPGVEGHVRAPACPRAPGGGAVGLGRPGGEAQDQPADERHARAEAGRDAQKNDDQQRARRRGAAHAVGQGGQAAGLQEQGEKCHADDGDPQVAPDRPVPGEPGPAPPGAEPVVLTGRGDGGGDRRPGHVGRGGDPDEARGGVGFRRLDPRNPGERALDAHLAGAAGHPVHRVRSGHPSRVCRRWRGANARRSHSTGTLRGRCLARRIPRAASSRPAPRQHPRHSIAEVERSRS